MSKLTPAQAITVNSTTAAVSTYDEWASDHGTYSVADNVKITVTGSGVLEEEYECLAEHEASAGTNPATDTTNWLDTGASNAYKMFDDLVSSQTEKATSIVVDITPADRVDELALFNVFGETVAVVCKSGVTEVYNESHSLDNTIIRDWLEYFYNPFDLSSDLVVEIPGLYPTLTINVTVMYTGATAKVGHLAVGLSQDIGKAQYSPSVSIADYSAKATNDFGETYLNQRAYAKTVGCVLNIDSVNFDAIATRLAAVRATPAVWQINNSSTDYSSLIVWGFFKDFDLLLQSNNLSTCSLEIEGLI